jgi:predicted ATPase
LIGRETELARLDEGLRRHAGDAERLVIILGEAGIGKSSVVAAVAGELVAAGGRVLVGFSHEAEQILPFGPWVDALRRAGIVSDEHVLERLRPVWRAELTRLLPEASAPGLPLPSDDYLRLFEGVAQLLEQLAAGVSLLVVLEDVHWADEMTIRLLAFLTRRLARAPVRLLATARSEELGDAPILRRTLDDLERQQTLFRLALGPLSPADTTALVRRLARVGTGDSEVERLGERVWTATEGNPFMVVETMRALDEGHEAGEGQRLPITDRLRRLIGGRLDRLSERARQVIDVAAVIGRDFEFDLLQRAARVSADEVASGLEELVRRGLLHGVGERFEFTHDRIRETTDAELLAPRRRLLHGDVACAMEDLYGEYPVEHVAAIGRHWFHAAAWSKAYHCLRRAGVAASAQSAHREAVALFEQALEALDHLPRTADWGAEAIDVRFELQNALLAFGAPERTEKCLREAEALASELGDRRRLARACAFLATRFRRLSDHDRALASARRSLELAESEGDFATRVMATSFLGHIYETRGEYAHAVDVLRRNLAALPGALGHERFGSPGAPGLSSRCRLALSLAERGEFAEALAQATEAMAISEELARPLEVCDACFAAAFVHLRRGDAAGALAVLDSGRRFGERGDLPVELALLASEQGYACALAGRRDEAIALLERASRDIEASGLRLRDALRATWLGEAYLLAGRLDDALRIGTLALSLAREHKERGVEGWAARLLGDVAARRGDRGGGASRYENAMEIADALGMRPLRAHCALGLGTLFDDPAHVAEASRAFRSMGMFLGATHRP